MVRDCRSNGDRNDGNIGNGNGVLNSFLVYDSNVERSGSKRSTAKIKETTLECSLEWLYTKQETGRNQ